MTHNAEIDALREAVAAATALGEQWVGFDDSHHYGDALLTALAPVLTRDYPPEQEITDMEMLLAAHEAGVHHGAPICSCGWTGGNESHRRHLARVFAERMAQAWDEGYLRADGDREAWDEGRAHERFGQFERVLDANPYRDIPPGATE